MPGEKGCQEAWLQENFLTAEELQEERPDSFSTTFADSPDRVRRAMESSSRFYGEWKLKSWVQNMNDEHGIAPPNERVYDEFHWKLAGQRHKGEALTLRASYEPRTRRNWVRRWRRRWECKLVKKSFREPMPDHVIRDKVTDTTLVTQEKLEYGLQNLQSR